MGGSCEDHFPPLEIVLGTSSFNGSPHQLAKNNVGGPSSSSTAGAGEGTPSTYILGTSYFATPRLGNSFGNGGGNSRRSVLKLNKDGRVPMEDRKGAFDHFKPKSLVLSTVRVTAINISTTMSTFFSDQLSSEQRIESMVDSGEITTREADEMNEEWEEREWQLRTEKLPKKIGWAILRFHACTALMRFYECIMARYVLRVDGGGDAGVRAIIEGGSNSTSGASTTSRGVVANEQAITIMDNLTRDTYQASLRTSQLLHNQEHSPGKVISSNGTETSTSRELTYRMFSTCLWANIIPFLAELTVQQGVLIYGYGVYYMAKQKKRREREEGTTTASQCKEDGEADEGDNDAEISESAYALSLMFRSSRLISAKSISWIAASAGGALGSVVYPGWGTVFGIQAGDTVVGALID